MNSFISTKENITSSIVINIQNFITKPEEVKLDQLNKIYAFCGLSSYKSRKNKIYGRIQKIMLVLNILSCIYTFILQEYLMYFHGISSSQIEILIYNLINLKLLWDNEKLGHKFDETFVKLINKLNDEHLIKMKEKQKLIIAIISSLTLYAFVHLVFSLYLVEKKVFNLELYIYGKENVVKNFILLSLSCFNINFLKLTILVSTLNYIFIQLLLISFAKICKKIFPTLISEGKIDLVKDECIFFNFGRKKLDQVMAFTEITFLLVKWFYFVLGITWIINNYNVVNSIIFIMVTPALIVIMSVLIAIIFYTHKANNEMKDARNKVGDIINSSESKILLKSQINQMNMYLIQDPIAGQMAWHFFEINPQLFLSSLNAMITFAVMVMTTFSTFLK